MAVKHGVKGVVEAVAAILAFALISASLMFILLYFYSTTYQQVAPIPGGYAGENLVLFMVKDHAGNMALSVKNVGSVVTQIDYVLAFNSDYLDKAVISLESTAVCTANQRIIAPGRVANVTCTGNYLPIAVVTSNGRVFSVDPQLHAISLRRVIGIHLETVYGGINITTTSQILAYLEDSTLLRSGAINTSLLLTPVVNYTDTEIYVEGELNASLVIIGKNPLNNRTNMLIIGNGTAGSYIAVITRENRISLSTVVRYRLKIENFTGDVNFEVGIHACYVNENKACKVVFGGVASRVTLYGANVNASGVVGLDPYVFVGDINNNGNVEAILVTQDFGVGNSTTINDRLGPLHYLDATAEPIRLVFTNVPIDSGAYSSAILSVRMFFWDNSLDDISDNDNRILIRVGLYDNVSKSFVYATSLSYYELCRYRHVKPFSISYIAKDFAIFIPKTGSTYYVAVELLDPFYADGTKNDADIIVGIEYIGIGLATR
ncbi:MAG: hypothetical protein QXH02_00095 [Desulfurococcaceae archaeon]